MIHHDRAVAQYASTCDKLRISKDEEQALLEEYAKTGSKKIADRIVTANLLLVPYVLSKWLRRPVSMDNIQVGNMGLMRAIEKFDISKKVRFATYAIYWIKAMVRREIEQQCKFGLVHTGVPEGLDMVYITHDAHDALKDENAEDVIEKISQQDQMDAVDGAMRRLRKNERRAIQEGLINGKSQRELATAMNLTRQGISFLQIRAIEKLKHKLARFA